MVQEIHLRRQDNAYKKKAVAWISVRRRTRNHVTKGLYLYFILDAETYFWRYLTSKTFLLVSINLWNMDAP